MIGRNMEQTFGTGDNTYLTQIEMNVRPGRLVVSTNISQYLSRVEARLALMDVSWVSLQSLCEMCSLTGEQFLMDFRIFVLLGLMTKVHCRMFYFLLPHGGGHVDDGVIISASAFVRIVFDVCFPWILLLRIWWSAFSLADLHHCDWLYCGDDLVCASWNAATAMSRTAASKSWPLWASIRDGTRKICISARYESCSWKDSSCPTSCDLILSIETFSIGRSSGASAYFRRYGDDSSTAPIRVKLFVLSDPSAQATPVQDFMRLEDSENLVGFNEKILLSSEEFHGSVTSEGLSRVHIDPTLLRATVFKHFVRRLIPLVVLEISLILENECDFFFWLLTLICTAFPSTVQCVVVTNSLFRVTMFSRLSCASTWQLFCFPFWHLDCVW